MNQHNVWIKGSFFNAKNYFDTTGSCQKLIKSSVYKAEDRIEQGYKPNQGGNGVLYHWENKPLAYYDIPTLNNMIFSKKLWEMIHENPFIKASMDNNCWWGEDRHRDESEVVFENVALRINDFHCEGENLVCGSIDLMDTPRGLTIYSLAKTGAIGTSSRGFGDLIDIGNSLTRVDEDTYLAVDWDAVGFPAVPNCMCLRTGEEQPDLSQSVLDLEKGLREQITSCIIDAHEKDPANDWITMMFNSLNLADKSKTFPLASSVNFKKDINPTQAFKKTYPSTKKIVSALKRGK